MVQEKKNSLIAIVKQVTLYLAALAAFVATFWIVINPQLEGKVNAAFKAHEGVNASQALVVAKDLERYQAASKEYELKNDADHIEIKQAQRDVEVRVEKRLDRMETKVDEILLRLPARR